MLLSPEAIFKDKPLQQLAPFFKTKLSVTQRARWRWIFPEPDGGSIYPRARARNEIMDSVSNWHSAEELSEEAATMVQLPHHRASVFHVGPKAAEDWAQFCLRTTNNEYDNVPAVPMTSPTSFNSIEVWLKMMKLAHSEALLKPGAMHALEAWATRATSRQREALSNLCLLLSDFVSTGGSSLLSETKLKYAPKSVPPREAAVPPEGQLGRPSTAPIVSAVQLKLEAKMKAANEMSVRLAVEMKNKRDRENARSGGAKKPIDPSKHPAYASTIPMKWPMKPPTLITTQHAAMRQVSANDARNRIFPFEGSTLPATTFNRMIGGSTWHGYAFYPQLQPVAEASFPQMRPLTSFPGFEVSPGKPLSSYRCN